MDRIETLTASAIISYYQVEQKKLAAAMASTCTDRMEYLLKKLLAHLPPSLEGIQIEWDFIELQFSHGNPSMNFETEFGHAFSSREAKFLLKPWMKEYYPKGCTQEIRNTLTELRRLADFCSHDHNLCQTTSFLLKETT